MKRLILWLPLLVFAIFLVTVVVRLGGGKDDRIHSQMIGKPVPAFALPAAIAGRPTVQSADFARGAPRILNVFASWCVPCIAEAPQLMELKKRGVPIDAIAIRDRPEDIAAFLQRWGDPFGAIGSDVDSRVQFALGSSGVPETFVIDGNGMIRHQHIGEIRADDLPGILKAYEEAR
jgi:cytochrome c biogenesis protein CcmG/thiol:disulfide interchange protein DsbE